MSGSKPSSDAAPVTTPESAGNASRAGSPRAFATAAFPAGAAAPQNGGASAAANGAPVSLTVLASFALGVALPDKVAAKTAVTEASDPHALQLTSLSGAGSADTGATPQPNFTPSDSLFADQWHLLNTGQFGGTAGIDIDVVRIWDEYTGAGVHVGVYDSGIQYDHHDLDGNYDASLSVIIDGAPHDPYPVLTSSGNAHGTNVAGLIAAENDGTGTVGVAFDASLTGVSIFVLSDSQQLQAFHQMSNFDVVNHSWGFTVPFADNILSSNSYLASFFAAFGEAVEYGRGGLGTIVVHSAGNDRTSSFNSGVARDTNDSNFTNSPFLIAVAAIDNTGFITQYSTPGAALLVSAPGGGVDTPGVWSTDLLGSYGFNSGSDSYTTDNSTPDYDGVMDGTSAASPIVAGVVALMLEANPNLGWRDVQDILAYSARHVGTTIGSTHTDWELYDWNFNGADTWNGGGLHFSNDYGFGLVDATAAVRLAETWTDQHASTSDYHSTDIVSAGAAVPDNNAAGVNFTFLNSVAYDLERVALEIDWSVAHSWVGDLIVTLTSPDGTVSTLLDRIGTAFGSSTYGLSTDLGDWIFTSNAFRGEDGVGTWTVNVSDHYPGDTGTISGLTLMLTGAYADGNDTYVYTDEYSTYAGSFGHATALGDSGGIDTLNAAAVTTNSIIDLVAGTTSTIAGKPLTIDLGTTIENAYAGIGDDTLIGNGADNVLFGGGGDDSISGGGGTDTAWFRGDHSDYGTLYNSTLQTFALDDHRDGTPDGTDTLTSIEQFQFSDGIFTPIITSNAYAGLNETLEDGGSKPWDQQTWTFDTSGSLATQVTSNDNGGHWQTFFDPADTELWTWHSENYDAGNHLTSDAGTNDDGTHWLTLYDVNDAYAWSSATIQFDSNWNWTSVSGTAPNDPGLIALYDTTTWFPTPFDANFNTTASDDILVGGANHDLLNGYGGNDTLNGRGSTDVLAGGFGDDTFVFQPGEANGDTVLDFNAHSDIEHDQLEFLGYGDGATLTQSDAMHLDIAYGGGSHDIITIANAVTIDSSDYFFV